MEKINIKQNDKGFDIVFEVVNADNTPMDLTTASEMKLHAKIVAGEDAVFTGDVTVFGEATAGICKYTVTGEDFAQVGTYNAEIQFSFGSDKVLTLPSFQIIVEREIA